MEHKVSVEHFYGQINAEAIYHALGIQVYEYESSYAVDVILVDENGSETDISNYLENASQEVHGSLKHLWENACISLSKPSDQRRRWSVWWTDEADEKARRLMNKHKIEVKDYDYCFGEHHATVSKKDAKKIIGYNLALC